MSSLSLSPILAMLLCPTAQAAQTLTGDQVQVHYNNNGIWNESGVGIGLQADFTGSGDWTEFVANGSAQQRIVFEWDQGGSSYSASGSYVSAAWTTTSETDLSTSSELASEYVWTYGDLTITKTEAWAVDATTIYVEFEIDNGGSSDVSNMRMLFWLDGDQDYPAALETNNDDQDLSGDGVQDWVQAVGPVSGYTVGLGVCDQDAQEIGSSTSFSSDADVTLLDDDGDARDRPINLRHTVGAIAAGDSIRYSFFVSLGAHDVAAQDGYTALTDTCVNCDYDLDGSLAPACGGADCDDHNADTWPGAPDTWYDGVDSDCGGGSDYDADGDSYDSGAYGGSDCNDADAGVHPGTADTWYDGVDTNCSGGSDYDADADGHDSSAYGGDDCDDSASSIHPGATEIWYDGVDQDCSGGSDYDADGDGHDSVDYGGDDCDDSDPSVWSDCGGDGGGDTGTTDGGGSDGGGDTGMTDGGGTDGGATDGGSTDGGSTDGGSTDGGSTDGGSTDGGSTDGGSTDGGSDTGKAGGGCNCATSGQGPGTAGLWFGLLGLGAVLRRRRSV